MIRKVLKGFTLAEVLITLAVIGVVAVLSIGIFMPKIQDKVLATQAKTAKIKFTKAMEQMALNNKIGPFYQDTEEFVAELQKYLKVAKVCKTDEFKDCFGYEEFDTGNGKTFSLDDLDDGRAFESNEDIVGSTTDFEGNTVGLVTVDGTSIILAWNKKCEVLEPGVYQWGNSTNKSTQCVVAVMDINSTKRPNKSGKDIVFLNAGGVSKFCAMSFTVNGQTYNWSCPFEPQPLNREQCIALLGNGHCAAGTGCIHSALSTCYLTANQYWNSYDGDRWAGAVQQCGGTDKMPSMADLAALATYLYNRSISETRSLFSENGIVMDTAKLSSLNSELYSYYARREAFTYSGGGSNEVHSSDWFYLWSGEECDNPARARNRTFYSADTTYATYFRYLSTILAVCKL